MGVPAMNHYDDYPTIEAQVASQTRIIDPTQPGQLAKIPRDSQADIVQTVYQHLPARKQTPQSIDALFQCLAIAPHDFADIARRHQVGPTEITVNRQTYNLQQYHQNDYGTYDQGHYYQPQFSPTVSPTFNPVIEVKPYIHVDANALAQSRSHQDNSGGDSRFWILVFAAIGIFAVSGVFGGK